MFPTLKTGQNKHQNATSWQKFFCEKTFIMSCTIPTATLDWSFG